MLIWQLVILFLVFGSYTYQFKSRDSLGFAVKATACIINGRLIEIYKHPKTDDGTKNSLKGLIRVEEENGKYVAYDQMQNCKVVLKQSL